jgi:hypothetical protein
MNDNSETGKRSERQAMAGGRTARRKRRIRTAAAMLLALLALSLASCAGQPGPIDVSDLDYGEDAVTVTGLGEDFIVTPAELAAMDCVDRKIRTKNSFGNQETIQATGPLLTEFVKQCGGGRDLSEFSAVGFSAADGYTVDLTAEELKEIEAVLVIRNGDEPLAAGEQPLRLATTGTESSYWVSGVREISFKE